MSFRDGWQRDFESWVVAQVCGMGVRAGRFVGVGQVGVGFVAWIVRLRLTYFGGRGWQLVMERSLLTFAETTASELFAVVSETDYFPFFHFPLIISLPR